MKEELQIVNRRYADAVVARDASILKIKQSKDFLSCSSQTYQKKGHNPLIIKALEDFEKIAVECVKPHKIYVNLQLATQIIEKKS